MRHPAAFFSLLVLVFPPPLLADSITLKNGARFEGKVVAETPELVTLVGKHGEIRFKRSEITEIRIDPAAPEGAPPGQSKAPVAPDSNAASAKAPKSGQKSVTRAAPAAPQRPGKTVGTKPAPPATKPKPRPPAGPAKRTEPTAPAGGPPPSP